MHIEAKDKNPAVRLCADLKPELYINGSISHGVDFDTDHGGLTCELQLLAGENWELLSDGAIFQTHISFPCRRTKEYVWSQSFETLYAPSSIEGWPSGILKVWKFDEANKLDIIAYCKFIVPLEPGYHEIECHTWTPIGDAKSSDLAYYFGNYPRIRDISHVVFNDDKLKYLKTAGNGTVFLNLNVIRRNFGQRADKN